MIRKIVFVFVIVLFGLSSCSSFIEEDTSKQFTEENIENSSEGAQTLVTGVYSKWIYDMFCWGYFPKVLEFDADYITGPDWNFSKFGAGNFDGESEVVDALWKGCYGLINRANYAERKINAMTTLSTAEKNNAIGELKFQKALAYFLLVRAYGEVPIQDETGENTDGLPRQSQHDVFTYITKNLEEAAGLMYKNNDASYQVGHVSAGSAAGLLVKVYATWASYCMPAGTAVTIRSGAPYVIVDNQKAIVNPVEKSLEKQAVLPSGALGEYADNPTTLYQKAKQWGDALIVDGQYGDYSLISDYDNLWKKTNATASEFMFSIGSVSGNSTYKTGIYKQYNGLISASASDVIANGLYVGCTHSWYKLFENCTSTGTRATAGCTGYTSDKRALNGVRHFWRNSDQVTEGKGFYYPYEWKDSTSVTVSHPTYYNSTNSQCLAFTTKYSDVTDPTIEYADVNWPMLRYADVLLMYAEALNELGVTSADNNNAEHYLNMVVNRSKGTVYGGYDLSNRTGMRSAIIEERAKELACEADRRWDLIRWGIYVQAMNAIGGSDDCGVSKVRAERHLLYPLPATEISTNKNINSNNPGWQ